MKYSTDIIAIIAGRRFAGVYTVQKYKESL